MKVDEQDVRLAYQQMHFDAELLPQRRFSAITVTKAFSSHIYDEGYADGYRDCVCEGETEGQP